MPEKIVSVNLDANESVYFGRELEKVKAQTYDKKYPQLKATQLIPVSTDAGPAAESITYRSFESVGLARIIANYADDLPRSDVQGKEFTSPIRSIGASYGYSIQEIRASQMTGKNLPSRKAESARRANDVKVDTIGWNGDAESGLKGLLNYPNVPEYTIPNGAGGTTPWANKTPDEILADMNGIVHSIVSLTKGVEAPNTMLLPIEQYGLIATKPRSSTSDTTILEFFLRTNQYIKEIVPVDKLDGAGTGGSDMIFVYDKSPECLTFEIPQPFEQFPAQERGLEFVIPCHSRCGGVIMYRPLAAAWGHGI